ncbi:MAG: hypothetical protein WCX61_00050 [Candidatus Peribacteraceae bacterium]
MPKFAAETYQSRDTILAETMHALQEAHTRDFPKPDHLRSTAYLAGRLNERVQQLLNASITLQRIDGGLPREGELPDKAARDIEAITRDHVMHILWNHVYSTPEHRIKSQRFGQLLVKQHLERCAMKHASSPETLKHMGLIAFDMDGTRQIRKYIGHVNTGLCLQGISRVLTETSGPTRLWLERDYRLNVTPTAIGGDEFAIILQGDAPLQNDFLTAVGDRYQKEITQDEHLRKTVDLTRPSLRAEFHEELPNECPITVACGTATPDEGILWTRTQDNDDHQLQLNGENSFEEQCLKIYAGTLHVADARLQKSKRTFKEQLERINPRLARFLTSTREDQNLMSRLKTGKNLLTGTLTTLRQLLDQFEQRLQQSDEGDEITQE